MASINTSRCTGCSHCTIEERGKADVFIKCGAMDKTFFYGQRVECESMERAKGCGTKRRKATEVK